MADFCSNCISQSLARAKFYGTDADPDIDVEDMLSKINEKLKEGPLDNWGFSGFICEGCGLSAVGWKDEKIKYGYINFTNKEIETDWEENIRKDD